MRYTPRASTVRAGFAGASLLLLAVASAGCTSTQQPDMHPLLAYDSDMRHPILLSNEPEVLDMPVGMKGPALSPELETAIRDYVREYRASGTGDITIQVPTDAANDVAAASTGHAVHYALVRAGVPRGRIQVTPYQVGDHSRPAPLRLSYLRVKAVVPTCGIWPEKGPNSIDDEQFANFGCAQQQNLAAMVANPADLVRPQPMTPASGGRRANVIKTYVDTGNTGWQPEPESKLLESSSTGF